MSLQFYMDHSLTRPLPSVSRNGKQVRRLQMPMNTPGHNVESTFYIYNNSEHDVQNLAIVNPDRNIRFSCEDHIGPRGRLAVSVSWHAPLSLKEALVCYFTVKADNVVRAQI